jgi:hypothetical protein
MSRSGKPIWVGADSALRVGFRMGQVSVRIYEDTQGKAGWPLICKKGGDAI